MKLPAGSLLRYLAVRILIAIPTALLLMTLVFVLMRVAPGNPIESALGGHVPRAIVKAKERAAGFDKPLAVQYVRYLQSVFAVNLGTTLTDHRPVSQIVVQNGGATLELTVVALIVALCVGAPLGTLAGRLRDSAFDVVGRLFGIAVYATPVFVLGLLAQLVFGRYLGLFPTSGQAGAVTLATMQQHTHILLVDALVNRDWQAFGDVVQHLVLPSFTLGLLFAGVFLRLVRVNVIQALGSDFVEAARARGLREHTVLVKHAFRNALPPVVTVVGLEIALLLSGAVLTEETFNWPGIGYELISYLQNRDYLAVQGIVTIYALVVVGVSLLIDIANALIDPRVRF